MEVRYSLTVWEVCRSYISIMRHWAATWVVLVGTAGLYTHSVMSAVRGLDQPAWVTVLSVALIVSVLTAATMAFGAVTMLLVLLGRGARRLRLERTLTLSDDGVSMVSRLDSLRTAWEGITKVRSNRSIVMLFLGNCSAHVVPRRCFASPAEAKAFLAYAQARAGRAVRV